MKSRIAVGLVLALALAACAPTPFGRGISGSTSSDERIAALTRTVAARPNDAAALNDLGAEYARRADWRQSAASYQEALYVNRANREANVGFGAAQAALGNYQIALEHARSAGGGIDSRNLEGIALAGLGQRAEAIALYQAAFAADPRDLDIRNNLAIALALGNDQAGYAIARQVAFAPGADIRHRRNFFLVAGILGLEGAARADGAQLGIPADQQAAIFQLGTRARSQGASAFGLAPLG